MKKENSAIVQKILFHPVILITVMASGCYAGLQYPGYSSLFREIGRMYLTGLQMCIWPFMFCTVAVRTAILVRSRYLDVKISKFVYTVFLGLVVAALLGIFSGMIGCPGSALSEDSLSTLGRLVSQSKYTQESVISYNDDAADENNSSAIGSVGKDSFFRLIPTNFFKFVTDFDYFTILVFALLAGVTLGFFETEPSDTVCALFDEVTRIMSRIINWGIWLLPAGLFFLLADQVSLINKNIVLALLNLVTTVYVSCFILIVLCFVFVSIKVKKSFLSIFLGLKKTIFLAFGTGSRFVCIPTAIDELQDNFQINRSSASLFVPISFIAFRFGAVMLFAITGIFMGQLYGIEFKVTTVLVILMASFLGGVITAGCPNLVTSLSMLSLTLDALALPFDIAFVLLLAVSPVIELVVTLVDVSMGCTAILLSSPSSADERPPGWLQENSNGVHR
uniref:dicarboxylate/amino acid:cation symporter n=1 Tax=Candidatus Electrothrix sp. TaxID=2170559 RepID=UPI004055EE16